MPIEGSLLWDDAMKAALKKKNEKVVMNFNITRRDYFAAMAMQGLLANSFADGVNQPLSTATNAEIAALARDQADHLIKALVVKPPLSEDK